MTFKFSLTIKKIITCPNIVAKNGQFLFYSHVQVLLSAIKKPKQTWSVEFSWAFAKLKEWVFYTATYVLDESIVT